MIINFQNRSLKRGMSWVEVAAIICTVCILVAGLYLYAVVWKRGSDRSANILNIRNCQQAMRGMQGCKQLIRGEAFTRSDLEEFMRFPEDVRTLEGNIAYRSYFKVTTESANPAIDWNHIWLIPSAAGLPEAKYGHESYDDVTGW